MSMVDGKAIAAQVLESVATEVKKLPCPPRLSAVTCAPNFETQKYLEMKQARAASIGIALNVVELPQGATTEMAVMCVKQIALRCDGVVVQLPFPPQVDREVLLSLIPPEKDPDGFQYGESPQACLPPVVGAIDEISQAHQVTWSGKRVVVLGAGRLVGRPAAEYARQSGAEVTVLTKRDSTVEQTQAADIIISGIGQPHFIKPDMVQDNVIIFDAGTSEDGGVLVGDADPAVAQKVALVTPVPGGIGPITIACLFRNLVTLASQK